MKIFWASGLLFYLQNHTKDLKSKWTKPSFILLSHWFRFLHELQCRLLVMQSCFLWQQHQDGTFSATSRPRARRDTAHHCCFFHYHIKNRYSMPRGQNTMVFKAPFTPNHSVILQDQFIGSSWVTRIKSDKQLYSSYQNGIREKQHCISMQELLFQIQGALKAWCLRSPAQKCRKPRFISRAKPSQQGTS